MTALVPKEPTSTRHSNRVLPETLPVVSFGSFKDQMMFLVAVLRTALRFGSLTANRFGGVLVFGGVGQSCADVSTPNA
jgi:hypothetical protein